MNLGRIERLDECVGIVPEDFSCVVRHAAPLDERAKAAIREQRIARMIREAGK